MSGSLECSPDLGPGVQEGDLGEPSNEQPSASDEPAPEPGSESLFGERKFKFPGVLWNQGGFNILVNPMCFSIPEYILSQRVFKLET